MEKAGLHLTHAQAAIIRPILQQVLAATQLMTKSENMMKSLLTPAQIRFVQQQREAVTFKLDGGLGAPKKPGDDPVLDRVIEILKKRAR